MSIRRSLMEGALVEEDPSQINFLLRKCDYCGLDVVLAAGDVLFGDRWFHARCWEKAPIRSSEVSK